MAYEKKDGQVTLWPTKKDPKDGLLGKDLMIGGKKFIVFGKRKKVNTKFGEASIVEISVVPDRESSGPAPVASAPQGDLPF